MRRTTPTLPEARSAAAAGPATGVLAFLLLVAATSAAAPARAQDRLGWDQPNYGEMVVDGFIVRPIGLVSTVLGTGAWIVTLPLSALGGNAGEAAQELIVRPARFTFTRPLGDF